MQDTQVLQASQKKSPLWVDNTNNSKKSPFVLVGIFFAVVVLISTIFRLITPKPIPSSEFNAWGGSITPGFSSVQDAAAIFGEPLDSSNTELGTKVTFTSPYPDLPHEVIATENGTILFVREHLPPYYEKNVSDYISAIGMPDLILKDQDSKMSLDANVFLQAGIVILSHVSDGTVEQKWYFVPTTKELFLASWGKNMTYETAGPELFSPIIEDDEETSDQPNKESTLFQNSTQPTLLDQLD
jgi:hypothetical protein